MYIHIKKNWHLQPRANVYLLMMELFFRDVNMWKHETLLHPLHEQISYVAAASL